MTEHNITGASARWAVLWLVKRPSKKPYLIEHEFGSDLSEALRVRDLALRAGKKLVTLRSMNVGFPPPEKYRPHFAPQHSGYKIVRRGGKRYRKKVYTEQWVIPLADLNARGAFWCPYCMKLRRFEKREGFRHEGAYIADPAYYCPVCNISSRDFHVRKWNPAANRFYSHPPRRARRTNSGKRRKRT